MLKCIHEIDEGFLISLPDLEKVLAEISAGEQQWAVRLLPFPLKDAEGQMRRYVALAYSNPGPAGMPNLLSLLYPLVGEDGSLGVGDHPLVCLHPSSVVILRKGIYEEDGRLVSDLLEDFNRFWPPIRRAILRASGQNLPASASPQSDPDPHPGCSRDTRPAGE